MNVVTNSLEVIKSSAVHFGLRKKPDGWSAMSDFLLSVNLTQDAESYNGYLLKIETSKINGSLVSIAAVGSLDGPFFTMKLHNDFRKRIVTNISRCTEKNVAALHANTLEYLPELLEEIKSFYAAKGE